MLHHLLAAANASAGPAPSIWILPMAVGVLLGLPGRTKEGRIWTVLSWVGLGVTLAGAVGGVWALITG